MSDRAFLDVLRRSFSGVPLLLGTTILFLHSFLSGEVIFAERDLPVFFIPPRFLWVKMLKDFELPLWNPHQYSGIPLLATLQPGVFYPPHILYLFLPFQIAWNWLIILHFFFSGLATYLFARRLNASELASFASGLTFMLSGYTLSVHNLIPHLFSVSWFPLVLLFFLKYGETGSPRHLVLSSVFLCMQFLAGAAEIVLMTLFVLLLLCFFLFRREILFGAKALLLLVLLFFLLCSAQLIPFLELYMHSIRRAGLSYEEATTWSFAWRDFLLFLLPDAFGYHRDNVRYWQNQSWLKTVYLGFAPFFLSTLYFLSKDKKRWIICLFMGLSFIFALGRYTPIYRLIYHVPPFGGVRYPVKFLFLFFFLVAITTGLGLDVLKEGVERQRKDVVRAVKVAFYLGFTFFLLFAYILLFKNHLAYLLETWGFRPDRFNEVGFNIHNLRRFTLFASVLSMLPLFLLNLRFKGFILSLFVVVLGTDLFLANYGYWTKARWDSYMNRERILERLIEKGGTERYFVTPKTEEAFKFFPRNKIAPGAYYASLFGLYSIDGSEVIRVRWHDRLLSLIKTAPSFEAARRWLEIAGVKYLISVRKIEAKGLKEIERVDVGEDTVHLYEMGSAIRVRLFGSALWVRTDEEAQRVISDPRFDHRSQVVLLGESKVGLPGRDVKGEARIVKYEPRRVVLETKADSPCILYLSDTFYPGWKAFVDGEEVEILRANLAFRSLLLPKGTHIVEFLYVPASFFLGLLFSLFGVALCLYLVRRPVACLRK